MKRFLKISLAIGTLLFIASCQKEIDVDLNEANPQTVIVANYNASDSIITVKITRSTSYFNAPNIVPITNAAVTITDPNGNTQVIPYVSGETYELNQYAPSAVGTFTITVVADGVTYTSSSTLRTELIQNPIVYEFFEQGFFGEPGGYLPFISFLDPPEIGNYYRAILQVNDTVYSKISEITLGDDELVNSNLVVRPIFIEYWALGDTLTIELQTIDKPIYDYYTQLAEATGGQNTAAPGNPYYLWTNKALGYFSAYYTNKQSVVIE